MAKAVVLFAEGFEDVEAVTAVDVLRRAEVEVTVAGLAAGVVTGARGTKVQVEAALADVAGRPFDAVVLPGGLKGAQNLAASPAVAALVRRLHGEGKLVAAICAAPAAVLAPLGLLDGKSVTGFPGTEARFPESATATGAPVAVDGNLVTGRSMGTALAFALAVAERLAGKAAADQVRAAAAP